MRLMDIAKIQSTLFRGAQQVDAPAEGRNPFTSVPKPDESTWKQTLAQLPGLGSHACRVNSRGREFFISLGNEQRERFGVEGGGLTILTNEVSL